MCVLFQRCLSSHISRFVRAFSKTNPSLKKFADCKYWDCHCVDCGRVWWRKDPRERAADKRQTRLLVADGMHRCQVAVGEINIGREIEVDPSVFGPCETGQIKRRSWVVAESRAIGLRVVSEQAARPRHARQNVVTLMGEVFLASGEIISHGSKGAFGSPRFENLLITSSCAIVSSQTSHAKPETEGKKFVEVA